MMSKSMMYMLTGMTFGGLFFMLFVFILFWKWFKPEKKLTFWEKEKIIAKKLIMHDLKTWAKHNGYLYLWNILYKYHNTQFFETDSIIITNNCIIVIEIQLLNGRISGNGKENNLSILHNNKEKKIANPIVKNDYTIHHLQEMIGIKVPIVSFVVFSDKSEKVEIENLPDHVVVSTHKSMFVTLNEVKKELKSSPVMTIEEMKTLFNNIKIHETKKKLSDVEKTLSLNNIKIKDS